MSSWYFNVFCYHIFILCYTMCIFILNKSNQIKKYSINAIDHIWRLNSQSYSMTHFGLATHTKTMSECRFIRLGALDTIRLISVGWRSRCVKCWSCTPADPGSIPGAGDKNKRLIFLPCNIRRCAPRVGDLTTLNGTSAWIRGGSPPRKRTSEDAKHSGSDHPQVLSAPNSLTPCDCRGVGYK